MTYAQGINKLISTLQQQNAKFMLYGATGYTGKLIVELIDKYKCQSLVVLAGRDESKVKEVARKHNVEETVAFKLDSSKNVIQNILKDYGVKAVLLTAGPFSKTAQPMIDVCLNSGISYLDITGEIDVFEYALADKTNASIAEKKEICIIPGVGFDVIPTDCLAKRVSEDYIRKYGNESPGESLEIAVNFGGAGSPTNLASRGTLKTMVEQIGNSGGSTTERKDSKLHALPLYKKIKHFKFEPSGRLERCFQIAWGDVSTAYHSTGVPNVSVYFAGAPSALFVTVFRLFMLNYLLWVIFKIPFIIPLLQKAIDLALPPGPSEQAREDVASNCEITAICKNKDGSKQVVGVAQVSSGYKFTAESALLCTLKVMAGEVKKYGCVTPSVAFGSDFLSEMDNCTVKVLKH